MNSLQNAKAHLSPAWGQLTDIIVKRSEGCYIYDLDDKPYLDFISGIGVVNTGHCHPRVVKAIQKQAGLLLHEPATITLHLPLLELVNELLTIVPSELDGFFFMNSGSEAIESAIKLARQATGKQNIIAFQGSFHGRTIGTMSLSNAHVVQRAGFQPMMPGVFVAPYPYSYRYGWDPEQTSQWCLNEIEVMLLQQTAPEETAAVLVEPVLGEGGYVVPPTSFMQGLRELCNKHEILLIIDEVQSGFGRTGRWFAHQNFDIVPDIMTFAKGIASGLPLSGIASRLDLMAKGPVGSFGGTFGGNAVACAAGVETIKVMKEENLLGNALERGSQLIGRLRKIQEENPILGDIRGIGLMIGTEFRTPDRKPAPAITKKIQLACRKRGLLLHMAGTWDTSFRWIPPLVVTSAQIDEAVSIFEESLREVINNPKNK
jgi:4-aminobutyrate aminotransferase